MEIHEEQKETIQMVDIPKEPKIIRASNYSDYNLLFHEDITLLGDGFHSVTTTTGKRFDTHPRILIYFCIMAGIMAANFLYFAQIWIACVNMIIHCSVLAIAVFANDIKRKFPDKIHPLYRESSPPISSPKSSSSIEQILQTDEFMHTYTGRMNWLCAVSNTYCTVPPWASWFLPILMGYFEFMLMIILIVWGTDTAPGSYCKNGYPDIDEEPDYKNGGCFIEKEISLLFGLAAVLGIVLSLGTLYDISPESIKSIRLARKRICDLFDKDPFEQDYFIQIETERDRLIKPLHEKTKTLGLAIGASIIFSFHVLYWERSLLYNVADEYMAAVVILYILNVIGFAFVSYFVIVSMHTNKNVYETYWVIMQIFARPLRIESIQDIRIWLEMRKLWVNYEMVIFFGCANGAVVAYCVIIFICILTGINWTFFSSAGLHIFSVPTLAIVVGGIVCSVYILRIFAMCAEISNVKTLHIAMLQQEKQKIRWKIYNDFSDNQNKMESEKIMKAIDDVCQDLEMYDKSPRIIGIPMTWTLYNIMLAYIVSGFFSFLSYTFLDG